MLPNIADVVVMRVLVRHGFSRDMADLLLEDTKRAIEFLQRHGGPKLSPGEGTGFTHNALPKEKLPPSPSPLPAKAAAQAGA
jgi:glutamate decarboxylase